MSSHDVRPPQQGPDEPAESDAKEAHTRLSRALDWYLGLEKLWDQTARKQIDRSGIWVTEGVPKLKQRRYDRRVRNRLANTRSRWRHEKIDEKLEIAYLGEQTIRVQRVLQQYFIREAAPFSFERVLLIILAILLILPVASSLAFMSSIRDIGIIDITLAWPIYLSLIIIPTAFIVGLQSDDFRWFSKTLSMFMIAILVFGCFTGVSVILPNAMLAGILALPVAMAYATISVLIFWLVSLIFGLDGRRTIDYLPVSHLAIYDLFELLCITAPYKNSFLNARTRRKLLRRTARVKDLMASRTTRRHIPISHDSHGFELVQGRSLQAFALAEETSAAILTSRNKQEYEDVVERLRNAIISLLDDDWSDFPAPVRVSAYSKFIILGTRLFTPLVLLGVAVGLQYAPFIDLSEPARTTIQVALMVSALLSVVPIDGDAKKQILSIFHAPPKQ